MKNTCPDYCPFLKKATLPNLPKCCLFDVPLMIDTLFIYQCEDCQNSDKRKSKYQNKQMSFGARTKLWMRRLSRMKTLPTDIRVKESPERQEIKLYLKQKESLMPGSFSRDVNKLLMNIYMVLDKSEKIAFKEILDNPKLADVFIKKIKGFKRNDSFLKNVRQLMDRIKRDEREKEELELEEQRQFQLSTIRQNTYIKSR